MTIRSIFSLNTLLLLVSCFLVSGASANLTGHTIRVAHIYEPVGEIGSFERVLNTEFSANLFQGDYIATVRADGASVEWVQGKILQGLFGFNGFVLTVVNAAPIVRVSILPTSTWSAFSETRLTFDANHIWADFSYLSSLPTQRVDIAIQTSVPETSTLALLTAGVFTLAIRRRIMCSTAIR